MPILAAAASQWGSSGLGIPYFLGTALAAGILLSPRDLFPRWRLEVFSGCILGVYLSHPFWGAVLIKTGISAHYLLPVATFAVSLLFTLVLRQALPRFAHRVT